MKKIEYITLYSYLGENRANKKRQWMVNYMEHAFSKEEYLDTILNDMGQKCWVLVSVTSREKEESYFFRREVIESENAQLVSTIETKLNEMKNIIENEEKQLEFKAEEEILKIKQHAKLEQERQEKLAIEKAKEKAKLEKELAIEKAKEEELKSFFISLSQVLVDDNFEIKESTEAKCIAIKQKVQETIKKDIFGKEKINTSTSEIKLEIEITNNNFLSKYYKNNVFYEKKYFHNQDEFIEYLNEL